MMLQLMLFALFFIVFGLISVFRKKKFLGWSFILLGAMLMAVAVAVVWIYPQTSPVHLFTG